MMFILLLHPPGLGFFLPHDSKLPYSCSAQCVCVCVCVCFFKILKNLLMLRKKYTYR